MVRINESIKVIVINILITIFLMSGFLGGPVKEKNHKLRKLKRFTSCKEMYNKLKELGDRYPSRRYRFMVYSMENSMGKERILPVERVTEAINYLTTKKVTKQSYSSTNVQVEGVDEADIVKTDGNYLYIVAEDRISIIKAFPPTEAKLLSVIPFSELERTLEIFIEKDILISIGSKRNSYITIERKGNCSRKARDVVVVRIYNISDRSAPSLVRKIEFEGDYTSSRKIGSFVYLVLTYNPYYYHPLDNPRQAGAIIPTIVTTNKKSKPKITNLRCSGIYYMEPINTPNFLILASISLDAPDFNVQKEIILGASNTIYGSLNNIYVANSFYDAPGSYDKTHIYKFSVKNGKIKFQGVGEVQGIPLNQFAMDEKDEYFRIVTQTHGSYKPATNVYVLNANLSIVGKIENLAVSEKLYSTRFFNNRLYMVTFKRIDPLFVVDLSDARTPKVLGELKIPGFSEYLHPYDENHIIGFGKDTTETPKEWATPGDIKGLKLALFDVSDPIHPEQKFVETIGDSGSDSEVLRNHKAFLFDKEKELLVFPAYVVEKGSVVKTFSGAYVYNLNLKDGFVLKGKISHYEENEIPQDRYYYHIKGFTIRRSLYIDNFLYTISDRKVAIHHLSDLSKVTELGY